MTRRDFVLEIVPQDEENYGVQLRQRLNGASGGEERALVNVWGAPLQAAMEQILDALRRSGYRPSEFHRGRRAPFEIREALGARIGLLLLALKPLRKTVRMEQVAEAIREMADEEVYYWFSKCMASPSAGRAFRILVAPESVRRLARRRKKS